MEEAEDATKKRGLEEHQEDTPQVPPAKKRREKKKAIEQTKFEIGDLVWAKMHGYPYWPGVIMKPTEPPYEKPNQYTVFFYGTKNHSWINQKFIVANCEEMFERYRNRKKNCKGLKEAVEQFLEAGKDPSEGHNSSDDEFSVDSVILEDINQASTSSQGLVKRNPAPNVERSVPLQNPAPNVERSVPLRYYWDLKQKKKFRIEDFYRLSKSRHCSIRIRDLMKEAQRPCWVAIKRLEMIEVARILPEQPEEAVDNDRILPEQPEEQPVDNDKEDGQSVHAGSNDENKSDKKPCFDEYKGDVEVNAMNETLASPQTSPTETEEKEATEKIAQDEEAKEPYKLESKAECGNEIDEIINELSGSGDVGAVPDLFPGFFVKSDDVNAEFKGFDEEGKLAVHSNPDEKCTTVYSDISDAGSDKDSSPNGIVSPLSIGNGSSENEESAVGLSEEFGSKNKKFTFYINIEKPFLTLDSVPIFEEQSDVQNPNSNNADEDDSKKDDKVCSSSINNNEILSDNSSIPSEALAPKENDEIPDFSGNIDCIDFCLLDYEEEWDKPICFDANIMYDIEASSADDKQEMNESKNHASDFLEESSEDTSAGERSIQVCTAGTKDREDPLQKRNTDSKKKNGVENSSVEKSGSYAETSTGNKDGDAVSEKNGKVCFGGTK